MARLLPNDVRSITRSSIKKSINELLYASGLRTPVVIDTSTKLNSRREIAMSYGFRKFFDTTCTHIGMNQTYIEFCLASLTFCHSQNGNLIY
jgi:hypothetical protein